MSGPAGAPLYKGEPLDADRGPGLGCFWAQVVVLVILVVLTPIGVANAWPQWLTTVMLFATLVLLLLAGQTVIFLLRLVAADRRTRRRPLRAATPTVGQLEDTGAGAADPADRPEDVGPADVGPADASDARDPGQARDVSPAGEPADADDVRGHDQPADVSPAGEPADADGVHGSDQPPSSGMRQ